MNVGTTESNQTIFIRDPESIYRAEGEIEHGTFRGLWHFSFGDYYDREYTHFGTLRVFNDDTLTPGAVWPLHLHSNIEVVTYCAEGEFLHADDRGTGDVLKKGWVQHTTIGRGLWHSEVNNLPDQQMRFIQMWFLPREANLKPSVEQMKVDVSDRTNAILPLVTNRDDDALSIASDAGVFACRLEKGNGLDYRLDLGRGVYLYAMEGGSVYVEGKELPVLGAAKVIGGDLVRIDAAADSELLFVDVPLAFDTRP